MISLGFITVHPNQEVRYITEIAKRSKQFGIDVYRFTPLAINPTTEKVHGYYYNNDTQEWEKSVFPIPSYLYDRCFYGKDETSKKAQPIVKWLKHRPTTTFLGHGLPNKWELYRALSKEPEVSAYLPSTELITSSSKVLHKLAKEKKLLLKPLNGSMGTGIIGLYLEDQHFHLITHQNKSLKRKVFSTKSECVEWLNKLFKTTPYLCQPFLSLQDHENRPFDIRILLQKNKYGKWHEVGRGIRKGQKDFIISNVSGGAEIIPFLPWVKELTHRQRFLLNENIRTVLEKLPVILETNFKNLFELGIDIGVAKDGSVWILDTNSKPGRKVIIATDPDKQEELYCAPLYYCKYLSKKASIV